MSDGKPIYLDTSKTIDERADDLLARMTLEEKTSQMLHEAAAVDRLGIPEYNWWSECLHGVARAGRATVFPQTIGWGATFDEDLIFRVADVISTEARAKHHAAARAGNRQACRGLTFWTPNVNIFRDPRWGRGQETYGEDPVLTGVLGTAFVKGLQGDDPKYMKAAACGKHYAVHNGPEGLRHEFNAQVSLKDLYETYLPAFKMIVDAGVESIMGAYNRTLDEPCCASKLLLQDILRGEWKFDGHVLSDCWAVRDFHENHKLTPGPAESAAMAVKAGCDLNCGITYEYLNEAVEKGLLTEEEIDVSVKRLMKTRLKLGMFDPEEDVPFAGLSTDVINCPEHRQLARETARKSMVLLKNENNLLPLKKGYKKIFVTGPNAASIDALIGNYYGVSSRFVTFLEGIIGRLGEETTGDYRPGVLLDRNNMNPHDWAVGEAGKSDVCIAVCGLDLTLEGEEGEAIASKDQGDRLDISLPQNQIDFLYKLKAKEVPVVLILTGGSPVTFPEDIADAVIYAWYPGEEGGNAAADILFGDVSPAGRLPVTFVRSVEDLPPFEDYALTGRTYRYMEKDPLYPFGFGLSYTSFKYSDMNLSSGTVQKGESVDVTVTVANTGHVDSEEVVQLYITDLEATVDVPLYSLKAFSRVMIKAGEKTEVTFSVIPEMMEIVREGGTSAIEPGTFRVTVGGSCPHKRSVELGAPEPVSAEFTVI